MRLSFRNFFVWGLMVCVHLGCSSSNFKGRSNAQEAKEDEIQQQSNPVVASCAQTTSLRKISVPVTFPANLSKGCPFGQGDNAGRNRGTANARLVQEFKVDLQQSSQLCALEFKFQNTQLTYDDHFVITFEDFILMSTSAPMVAKLEERESGFKIYDWLKIRGIDVGGSSPKTFCLGENLSQGSCSIPVSEQTGEFTFSMDPALVQKLHALVGAKPQFTFRMIAFGDDDVDCTHSGINMDVEASYLP